MPEFDLNNLPDPKEREEPEDEFELPDSSNPTEMDPSLAEIDQFLSDHKSELVEYLGTEVKRRVYEAIKQKMADDHNNEGRQ